MPTLLNKVVVHYLNGRIVKGIDQDFYPNRETFHVAPPNKGTVITVKCPELKAIFFVHDYEGNSKWADVRGFLGGPEETRVGRKTAVFFRDSELICGYSMGCREGRKGFFLFPADKTGNNSRIYVFEHATLEIKFGPEADELAQRVINRRVA